MAGKFEIKKSKDNQFYFNLKAGNGEIILTSEMYKAKASAEKGIASVKTNAPDDGRYDRKTATNGQFYFNLKAANGEVIGTSEMYTTSSARDNGIESVKNNAPEAAIVDLT
ncbi:MAG: YegP family protein [Pleurocapsa sp. MO_226.B13]|nr:YegP family protein [Pleurocapsa sp. MO_226.B13]